MTATNETDHGCSCGRPDCRYDEKYGNPLRAVAPNTLLSAEQIVALDRLTHLIASELARIDGFDPDDQHGGLYDLRWQGGSMPEPLGDAWSMDYLPKAERIAHAAVAAMAEREAALVREVEELRAAAQPFVRHNSSDETTTITVKGDDIRSLRYLLARAEASDG